MRVCTLIMTGTIISFIRAQTPISFTLSDVPVPPSQQRIAIDTLPLPPVNYGNPGPNQIYDFSNLTLYRYDTVEYRNPTSSQLSTCPQADAATTLDGINFLLTNTTTNKLILEGFEGQVVPGNTIAAEYSTKPDIYQLPMNYGTNFSGSFYLQKTFSGSQVGQPSVHQVRFTISGTYTDTVDGWGAVKTPLGTYKCLRNKRIENTTTQIEVKVFSFSPWSTVSNNTNTTLRYTYLTKETKGSAVSFDYDSLGNLRTVSWSMIPPNAPVANFNWVNTSGGLVNFTDASDNYPTAWSWNFGDGSPVSTQQNPSHVYTSNGNYNVCLTATNAGGSHTTCKIINVTNITPVNNKPIANDDNYTDTAGQTNIFHVAFNDVDPDGNTLCVTSVWGAGGASVISCNSIQLTTPPGLGVTVVLQYVVCDNGSPVLCDTGTVTITLLPSNLAPNAVNDQFTVQQGTSANLNLLSNDTDPNGNALCLDTVWGSPYAQLIGGNCTQVKFMHQKCFNGSETFWYRVCDNGNPALCDTGQVTVNVTPDSAYISVASFGPLGSANIIGNCDSVKITHSSSGYTQLLWKVTDFAAGGSTSVYTTPTLMLNTSSPINLQVCLVVSNTCNSDTLCHTLQETCVGMPDLTNISGVVVYPNPAFTHVTIDWRAGTWDETPKKITVYNSLGAKVYTIPAGLADKHTIEVVSWPAGVYHIAAEMSSSRMHIARFFKLAQ
ncbi:MAG: Ig-like domain-containing protein [Chitinophagales bacterium]|nr:Ig-like domain-containing protein [Chitinophagales bacterium]MDW8418192.1 Ig-like domain-containing protein [Chitinophagales bacterium]